MKTNSSWMFRGGRYIIYVAMMSLVSANCKRDNGGDNPNPPNPPGPTTNEVDFWLTKSDETVKLQKQTNILAFANPVNQYSTIEIDEATTYQSVDGFGYT